MYSHVRRPLISPLIPKLRPLYPASPRTRSITHIPILVHGEIIDDSEWNTFSLQLSDGWNMARPTQIEALNGTEVEDMREYGLGNFYNSSIS
jgi:hypothetical protein